MGIPLKEEYFEQKSITLMPSAGFLFHFDCLKHVIKKQSNLSVQRGGKSSSYFLIKRKQKFFNGTTR